MYLKTHSVKPRFLSFHGLAKPTLPKPAGTLSRQELSRIVAEMLD